ncbi:MAG: hypothetical protein M3Q64_01855, partial [bacterium]|nr:hypothetical protein [bacterium]
MIIPAILEQNIDSFNKKLELLKQISKLKRVQVDFCDGEFVENTSLTIDQIENLPPKIEFEAHIMHKEPKNFAAYKNAGFSQIVVHYEAFSSELVMEEAILDIKKLEMGVGVAINPETPVSTVRYFADTIDHFTVMTVQPGKQGSEFLPESIERVEELRSIAPDATIEVDGG